MSRRESSNVLAGALPSTPEQAALEQEELPTDTASPFSKYRKTVAKYRSGAGKGSRRFGLWGKSNAADNTARDSTSSTAHPKQ